MFDHIKSFFISNMIKFFKKMIIVPIDHSNIDLEKATTQLYNIDSDSSYCDIDSDIDSDSSYCDHSYHCDYNYSYQQ